MLSSVAARDRFIVEPLRALAAPGRPGRTALGRRVLSAASAFPPAGTLGGDVPDGARPGRGAEDRLGDEDPEVLERLAHRIAGVTHGADRSLPLVAGKLLKLFPYRVRTPDLQELQQASGHQPGGLRRAHLPGFAVLFFREQDDRLELRIAQQAA